jgi:uncharacterized protein (UPF0335 family)
VIQRRKKDPGDLQESDAMVDLYETTVAADSEMDELAQSE